MKMFQMQEQQVQQQREGKLKMFKMLLENSDGQLDFGQILPGMP